MPNCAAFGCTNRSSEKPSLLFRQIPSGTRDKQLRTRWLNNIKRDGELPKNNSFYICSEHFEDECFERDLKVRFKFSSYLVRMGYYNRKYTNSCYCFSFRRKSLWRIRWVQDG